MTKPNLFSSCTTFFPQRFVRYLANGLAASPPPHSDVVLSALGMMSKKQQIELADKAMERLDLFNNGTDLPVVQQYLREDVTPSEFISELYESRRIKAVPAIAKLVSDALNRLQIEDDGSEERLINLVKLFKLSPEEGEILLLLYFTEGNKQIDILYNQITSVNSWRKGRVASADPQALSILSGLPRQAIGRLLKSEARLFRSGLIDDGVACEVSEYLSQMTEEITSNYFTEYKGKDFLSLGEFNLPASSVQIFKKLVMSDSPANLILYGEPGVGKTTFARSLVVKECKKRLLEVRSFPALSGKDLFKYRQRSLIASQNLCEISGDVVFVDDAEFLLNGSKASSIFGLLFDFEEKASVNTLLDSAPSVTIWAVNSANFPEYIVRRFDFSLGFPPLGNADREKIWVSSLNKHGQTLSENTIKAFSKDDSLSPAVVESVIKNASKISDISPEETTPKLITAYKKLKEGGKRNSKPMGFQSKNIGDENGCN